MNIQIVDGCVHVITDGTGWAKETGRELLRAIIKASFNARGCLKGDARELNRSSMRYLMYMNGDKDTFWLFVGDLLDYVDMNYMQYPNEARSRERKWRIDDSHFIFNPEECGMYLEELIELIKKAQIFVIKRDHQIQDYAEHPRFWKPFGEDLGPLYNSFRPNW
ncbi:hypothetical protein ACFLZ9_00915 [Patescibacteria group bacterium]